jgi:hypothetical protein
MNAGALTLVDQVLPDVPLRPRCKLPLRLIALVKTGDTIKRILFAMGLPTEAPKLSSARAPPPPTQSAGEGGFIRGSEDS